MLRAGRFDRLITVQCRSTIISDAGDAIAIYNTMKLRCPAAIWTPQSGDEVFHDPQLVAREKVEWLIRYDPAMIDCTPLDRIIYPALEDVSPEPIPDESNIYDIISIHEVGRREGLRYVTARRPDAL